jgi:ketosteroid isomerase-like protein
MSTEDVVERVQALADRFAILDTVTAYSLATDERDWEAVGALFTEDAVWEYAASQAGGARRGIHAITKAMQAFMAPMKASQHANSNHLVRLHGDEAEHVCYFTARFVRGERSGGGLYVVAGRYDDRLVRTSAGWRFARRTVTPGLSADDPALAPRA